jgi:hypothetical protein
MNTCSIKRLCKDNHNPDLNRLLSRFSLAFLCCMLCLIVGCASASIQKGSRFNTAKKRIAVISIPSQIPEKTWSIIILGNFIKHHAIPVASYLEAELMGMDMYTVVERGQLETVLKEHKLSLSGLVGQGDYKTIGRLTGLDALVVVNEGVTVDSYIFLVAMQGDGATAKMIDVDSGELIWSAEGQSSWVSIFPLLPYTYNPVRAIARAIAGEIKGQK